MLKPTATVYKGGHVFLCPPESGADLRPAVLATSHCSSSRLVQIIRMYGEMFKHHGFELQIEIEFLLEPSPVLVGSCIAIDQVGESLPQGNNLVVLDPLVGIVDYQGLTARGNNPDLAFIPLLELRNLKHHKLL